MKKFFAHPLLICAIVAASSIACGTQETSSTPTAANSTAEGTAITTIKINQASLKKPAVVSRLKSLGLLDDEMVASLANNPDLEVIYTIKYRVNQESGLENENCEISVDAKDIIKGEVGVKVVDIGGERDRSVEVTVRAETCREALETAKEVVREARGGRSSSGARDHDVRPRG